MNQKSIQTVGNLSLLQANLLINASIVVPYWRRSQNFLSESFFLREEYILNLSSMDKINKV